MANEGNGKAASEEFVGTMLQRPADLNRTHCFTEVPYNRIHHDSRDWQNNREYWRQD